MNDFPPLCPKSKACRYRMIGMEDDETKRDIDNDIILSLFLAMLTKWMFLEIMSQRIARTERG